MSIEQIGLVVLFMFVVGIGFILNSINNSISYLMRKEKYLSKRAHDAAVELAGLYQTSITRKTPIINTPKRRNFKVKPPGRTPKLYAFEGIQHTIKDWAKITDMSHKTLYQRTYKGLPLLTPEEFARISTGAE